MSELQLFAPLPPAVEAALRASIRRFGVIVPVVKDQHGRIIDGHHRARIAAEERKDYRVETVQVADDAEAKEMARTLNADRRQLTEEQRREVVALLAGETVAVGRGGREEVARHSPEAIAGALGVAKNTVVSDIEELVSADKLTRPNKTLGLDGKVRPTRRPTAATQDPAAGNENQPEPPKKRAANRKPLPEAFRTATYNLLKAAETVHRLTEDDRWNKHAPKIDSLARDNLRRATRLLSKTVDSLIEGES